MGENHLAAIPTAIYGFVLLMAAIAFIILERSIAAKEGRDSVVASAISGEVLYVARVRHHARRPISR